MFNNISNDDIPRVRRRVAGAVPAVLTAGIAVEAAIAVIGLPAGEYTAKLAVCGMFLTVSLTLIMA